MRTHRKAGRKAGVTCQKWVAALGIAAAAPAAGLAQEAPTSAAPTSAAPAAATQAVHQNQVLADAVAGQLRGSGLRGKGIEIVVREGVCRLTGTVPSPQMKALATAAASKVDGVTSVDNAMTVAGPTGPRVAPIQTVAAEVPAPVSNQAVAQQIAIAVQETGVTGYQMDVRFKDGVCTLDGQVEDAAQIAAVASAAGRVAGVSRVANNLSVGSPLAAPAAPRGMSAEDRRRGRDELQRQYAMSGMMPPGMDPRMAGPRGPMGPGGMGPGMVRPASRQLPAPGCPTPANPAAPGAMGAGAVYNQAALPDYAWPTYAQHPNYAQVSYPKDYSASAWPYIGPFYPYPQVPLGWREVELEWDDGQWYLDFNDRTDRWWWFLKPENW